MTGIDFPGLALRIETALQAVEPSVESPHAIIITDEIDSLKSRISNLLKTKHEGVVQTLIIEHPKQTATSAYRGIKAALANLFNTIYSSSRPEESVLFLKELKENLGPGFPLFASFVPEVTGGNRRDYGAVVKNLLYIESELFPVVKSFFIFLEEYYQSRVFIFVNEFHNVDGPSLNLLAYLLRTLPPEKWICFAAGNNSQAGIDNLQFLADGRAGDFFVGQMNLSVTHEVERVLLKHVGEVRPEWVEYCLAREATNEEAIRNLLPDFYTSAAVIAPLSGNSNNLRETLWANLSGPCRKLLTIMTCFGKFDWPLCYECFDGNAMQVKALLEEASEQGFLVVEEDQVDFVDALTEEDVRRFITIEEKEFTHYTIGHALLRHLTKLHSEDTEKIAAEHFNQALAYVRKNSEQRLCGELNFKAAQFLQQHYKYHEARLSFTSAADLLKECPWNKVDAMLYEVLLSLARLEYQLGEYDPAEHHIDYLLDRVDDRGKRASLYEMKVVLNNRLGRYRKAVLMLKEGLMELGLDMPWQDADIDQEVDSLTHTIFTSTDTEEDRNFENDPANRQAILKLLSVGGMSLHHTSDGLMTWGALQVIYQSGPGLGSGEKAIGYVVFGRVQIMRNEIELGYTYGLKALQINQSRDDLVLRCRVYGIFAFFIQPWKLPFEDSFKLLTEAGEAGEKSGDLIGAYVVKTHCLNLLLLAGKPLPRILDINVDESNPSSELTYYITHYQKNLVRFLMNESSVFSIPHLEPSWLAATNTIQEEKFYRNFVWSRYYFLFGYYELAEDAAFEANENRKLQEAAPLIPANYFIWFLSITQNWPNIPELRREEKLSFLKEVQGMFAFWAQHSPANFGACHLILQAELLRLEGEAMSAAEKYKAAIAVSGDNLWYKAIAMELAAKFYLAEGQTAEGIHALNQSIDRYFRWGAIAKVSQLHQQYSAYVGPDPGSEGINIEVIQHELSGYLHVRIVVKKLLALCLRISGSSSALLASREGNAEITVLDQHTLFAKPNTHPKNYFAFHKIQEALRLEKTIIGNDDDNPTESSGINGEVTERKSFLVVPVFLRDHLSFVLYLESVFASNAYPHEVIRWIRIALNQGAITIENARIHELSLKLNQEIRQKMEEKERLMNDLKEQRDLHLKAVERTQNEDRKRIASNLHDSVGSMLSSIKMRLNSLQTDFENHVPEKAPKFSATIGLIDETVHELRRIVYDMLPVSLHRFGLQPTLHTFVDQINESQEVRIDLQILGLEERLNEELEMAVYRICQELVQNVLKHAAATTVRIQIIRHHDRINVIVEDNGKGMDRNTIVAGIGFNTITAKINLYRGSFEIESSPAKGTMILIDIPLTDNAETAN